MNTSDTDGRFVNVFRQLFSISPDIHFFPLSDLELAFTDTDFRDPVHLNLFAARRLSDRVTERIIKPILIDAIKNQADTPCRGVSDIGQHHCPLTHSRLEPNRRQTPCWKTFYPLTWPC